MSLPAPSGRYRTADKVHLTAKFGKWKCAPTKLRRPSFTLSAAVSSLPFVDDTSGGMAPKPTAQALKRHPARHAARVALIETHNENRAEEAAFIFHKYSSGDGMVDNDLLRCFLDLGFSNGRQNKTDDELKEWARKELKKGNKKGDGRLSHEEFVEYYNKFVVGHRRRFEETYEMGQQIGKGAFGSVFKANRIGGVKRIGGGESGVSVGTSVAVKQIKKAGGLPMELLHNEITIWETLKHPNLVRLLDVFETDDQARAHCPRIPRSPAQCSRVLRAFSRQLLCCSGAAFIWLVGVAMRPPLPHAAPSWPTHPVQRAHRLPLHFGRV